MNFLALVKNAFQGQDDVPDYSSDTQALAIPKPVNAGNYIAPSHYTESRGLSHPAANAAPKKPLWKEHKRIQRLRQLAQLGFYGNSQIEGVKIKGTEANMLLKLYDAMDENKQNKLITMPMHKFVELANEVAMRNGI